MTSPSEVQGQPESRYAKEMRRKAQRLIEGGEIEGKQIRELFLGRLDKVCDGSVYTSDRLCEIFGVADQQVIQFVRMCEVFPGAKVLRRKTAGRKQIWEYQFTRVPVDPLKEELIRALERAVEHANSQGYGWMPEAVELLNKAKGGQPK